MNNMPIEFQILIAATAIGLAGWLGKSLLKVLQEIRDEVIDLKLIMRTHDEKFVGMHDKISEHDKRIEKHEDRLLKLEQKN